MKPLKDASEKKIRGEGLGKPSTDYVQRPIFGTPTVPHWRRAVTPGPESPDPRIGRGLEDWKTSME